jgi:two-component system, cell cycle response regulator
MAQLSSKLPPTIRSESSVSTRAPDHSVERVRTVERAESTRPERGQLASLSGEDWDELDTGVSAPQTLDEIFAAAPPPLKQTATFVLLTGLNAGQVFTIERDNLIIGRGKKSHLRIDDNGISREHARVECNEDGEFRISDMGSRNGTYVNGKRVTNATLRPGDRVHIGPSVVMRFAVVDEAEEKLARQLYEASTRDALTRVYNRRYFNERLMAEVAFSHRHKSRLGVIIFDIDHFKKVNDQWGHMAGDDVLREVSAAVNRLIRTEDVLARYGGEEFVVLTRSITPAHMLVFAERIRSAVEAMIVAVIGGTVKVTISLGVASLAECGAHATGDVLMLMADERLYRAKAQGRNCVAFE